MFDIYTIIFLALAVFIFLRLRSVLGQRTGRERPPYDPYSAREARSPVADKVVTLPPRPAAAAAPSDPVTTRPIETPPTQPADRWKDVADSGSGVAGGLDAIIAAEPDFDAKHFIAGARAAYEMIVTAFAEGNRGQLRNLLSREVFDGFDAAIGERERRSETAESRFVSIDGSTIAAAELRGPHRADHRSLRFQAGFRHAGSVRYRDRWQRRQGQRRHRRLDFCARCVVARSELEGCCYRSRTVKYGGKLSSVAGGRLLACFSCAGGGAERRIRADQIS